MTRKLIKVAPKGMMCAAALTVGVIAAPAQARHAITSKISFIDVTRPSNAPRVPTPRLATTRLISRAPASLTPFSARGDEALPPYLQCVPYARMVSGVQLRGDAHTWWQQAAGQYARGFTPKVGAVMAFKPHGGMVLGHVAAVSRVIDSRTVLLRHANWSPIHGRRGQIEDNVRAIDVSAKNDWSEVRVWFAPIKGMGTTRWPVEGFIYNRPVRHSENGATRKSWASDPIGAIIAAFSRK